MENCGEGPLMDVLGIQHRARCLSEPWDHSENTLCYQPVSLLYFVFDTFSLLSSPVLGAEPGPPACWASTLSGVQYPESLFQKPPSPQSRSRQISHDIRTLEVRTGCVLHRWCEFGVTPFLSSFLFPFFFWLFQTRFFCVSLVVLEPAP